MSCRRITEPDGYLEPIIADHGFAAIPALTITQLFQQTVAKFGQKDALFLKRASLSNV